LSHCYIFSVSSIFIYLPTPLFFFSLLCLYALRDLHSFPTRRSSDLAARDCRRQPETRPQHRPRRPIRSVPARCLVPREQCPGPRSEEHTSELQSRFDIVCRLLLEKKKP